MRNEERGNDLEFPEVGMVEEGQREMSDVVVREKQASQRIASVWSMAMERI